MEEKDLPLGWVRTTLDKIIIRISNGANVPQFDEQIGYPITRIETIWNESIDFNRVKYVKNNDDYFIEKYKLLTNDILFSHINSDKHIGKTAIVKLINQDILIHGINLLLLRPSVILSAIFLNYQFKYFRNLGYFASIAQKSVNQSSINQNKLKLFKISLPPLAEQQRIVAKLEELFSELDKGIESLKTAQQQLKVYRQAVLKYAFEGKLTNPSVKDGELPEGWVVRTIGEVANVVRGGSPRPAGDSRFYNGDIPFLKVRDLTKDDNMFITYAEHSIKQAGLQKTRLVKAGTLLLSNSGATLGVPKITSFETTMNDGIVAFLDLKSDKKFLFYYWKSKTLILRAIDQGAAQPNLNTELIREQIVILPSSLEEQHSIVQEIESRLSVCDKIEESIEQGLKKAEALRQSILKKAFEGKLVPQNLADEPASLLLERIQKERAATAKTPKTTKLKKALPA